MENKMTIKKVLHGILQKTHMTISALALELRVGRNTLYDWLSARRFVRGKLYQDRIYKLAKKYGVKVEDKNAK
jgi:hypothetical protein